MFNDVQPNAPSR